MVEIVVATLSLVGVIVVGYFEYRAVKYRHQREKEEIKKEVKQERLEKIRAKEMKMSMDLMYATAQLSVGVGYALKRGHANGELDAGLAAVEKVSAEYEKFVRETAADMITI